MLSCVSLGQNGLVSHHCVSPGHGPMGHEEGLERLELRGGFVQGVGRALDLGPSPHCLGSGNSNMGSLGCHTVSHIWNQGSAKGLGFLHPVSCGTSGETEARAAWGS